MNLERFWQWLISKHLQMNPHVKFLVCPFIQGISSFILKWTSKFNWITKLLIFNVIIIKRSLQIKHYPSYFHPSFFYWNHLSCISLCLCYFTPHCNHFKTTYKGSLKNRDKFWTPTFILFFFLLKQSLLCSIIPLRFLPPIVTISKLLIKAVWKAGASFGHLSIRHRMMRFLKGDWAEI